MFKIIQQFDEFNEPSKFFTVYCYYFDTCSHSNQEAWSIRNLLELDVARLLQDRNNDNLDMDFTFVVVKSGNGPAIITDHGELMSAPVKIPDVIRSTYGRPRKRIPELNERGNPGWKRDSLFQTKRRKPTSN